MSTITRTTSKGIDVLHPLVASLIGVVAFAAAMIAGEVFGLNADAGNSADTSLTEVLTYVALGAAAVALGTWIGLKARSGSPDRLARFAVGLAVASAITFVAFWSGWPQVLGAVAVASSFEYRRRVGGFGAMSGVAAVLGGLALVASTYICVVG